MKDTESGNPPQSGQIPLSGPGFIGRAAYHDKRARNPDDAFRLYYFADRADVKGAAKAVLWALAHRCDYRSGYSIRRVSVPELASATRMTDKGVQNGCKALVAAGYLEVLPSEHPGSREDGANHYRIVIPSPLRPV